MHIHDLAVDVDFTISAINTTELAELNQELFDKLFDWPGAVASLDELKAKIKEDAESQICTTIKPKLADVTEFLISSTKFDLPSEFLKNG
jgi:trigger factor